MTEEDIWHFVDWIEKNRAVSLYHNNGYDDPHPLWDKEIEELVKDYLIWNPQEEE